MNEKLDVGRVFERIFSIYKDQFTLLIPAALIIFVPVALINGLFYDEGGVLLTLAASALSLVATYWYQGMVVEAARDTLDGRRDHTVGSLFSAAGPVVGRLIGAGILAGIGIAIGFVLLIVPGLFLLTIWAVIVPVIVLERAGVFESFGRSRELVRGHGWQVFGVIVLLFLAGFIVRLVIGAIMDAIFDSFLGFGIAELLVSLLMVPLTALAAAVIYFELKRLKGEPIPGAEAGGELEGAGLGAAPEAPTSGASTPSAEPAGSDPSPPPQPGSPPPPAPRPGGTPPAGGDPGPQSSGPQDPPNA